MQEQSTNSRKRTPSVKHRLLIAIGIFTLCVGPPVGVLTYRFVRAVAALHQKQQWSRTFFDPALEAETKIRAETIAAAIRSYVSDHGALPGALEELTPNYLSSIPKPTAGWREWEYGFSDEADISTAYIAFGSDDGFYPCWILTVHDGDWRLDD